MQVRTAINQNKDQQTKFTCHERPPRATKMQEGRQAAGILPCLPRKSLKRSSNPGALYPLTTLVAPLAFQISSFGHWGLACSPLRRQIPISGGTPLSLSLPFLGYSTSNNGVSLKLGLVVAHLLDANSRLKIVGTPLYKRYD